MLNFENINENLPKYLSPDSLDELKEGIKQFFEHGQNKNVSSTSHLDESTIFQGDIIKDVKIFDTKGRKEQTITGMVLSNTCDISHDNERVANLPISFCYVRKLSRYKELIIESDKTEQQAEQRINDIRNQMITNLYYLPAIGSDFPESVVHLERIFIVENDELIQEELIQNRLISLNNLGFWVLLNKISMHFCRFWEKVDRK